MASPSGLFMASPLFAASPSAPLRKTAVRAVTTMRLGAFAVCAPMALLSAVPPVSLAWLLPVLVGFGLWVAVFARVALTRGLVPPLVAADLVVHLLLCAFAGRLVPLERIPESSGWTAAAASLCVMTLPMAWRAPAAVPAGLLMVGAYVASFPLAGLPLAGADNAAVLVLQLLSSTVVMAVIRRAGTAAEAALSTANQARAAAAVAAARRADVAAHLRLLHDTALTTLTLVGTGAVGRSSTLTGRASADLAALDDIVAAGAEPADLLVRLDEALARAVRDGPSGLDIAQAFTACQVPAPVASAFAGSVGEALRNVDRHAGARSATVSLTMSGGIVRVEVADDGVGFDPSTSVPHRYGVRESIVGRMIEAGGRADVESAPGSGTRWILLWPRREGT